MAPRRGIKVLLINPTFVYWKYGWPPLGLCYLAAALREAGHDVRILDPTHDHPELSVDFVPDLVGIGVWSTVRHGALQTARGVRASLNVPIVVGGPDATSSWLELLREPCIDYACIGEGEQTIVEMANCMAEGARPDGIPGTVGKRGDKALVYPARPLMQDPDAVPLPARDLVDMNWYGRQVAIRGTTTRSTTVMTARGCPRDCIFCDSRRTWTRKYRPHSVDRVVEEVRLLRDKYAIGAVSFVDDTFPVQRRRTLELCERFARELPGIQWCCQARIGELDEELLLALKAGGCVQVEFGVESGSQRVLDFLKKGFTVEQSKETFALCRKHGMRTFANFLVGTPHETRDDVEASLRLCRELRPDVADMWAVTPYPGTDLFCYCEANGLLAQDYQVATAHHGHSGINRYFIRSELSEADVSDAMMRFYFLLREIGSVGTDVQLPSVLYTPPPA